MRLAVPGLVLVAAPAIGRAEGVVDGVAGIDVSGVVLSLGLIVACIVVGAYLLRRTPFGSAGRGNGPLKLVATLPLGPRERLLLVTNGGREILVGVSPAGVSIASLEAADRTPSADAGVAAAAELASQFGREPAA